MVQKVAEHRGFVKLFETKKNELEVQSSDSDELVIDTDEDSENPSSLRKKPFSSKIRHQKKSSKKLNKLLQNKLGRSRSAISNPDKTDT